MRGIEVKKVEDHWSNLDVLHREYWLQHYMAQKYIY